MNAGREMLDAWVRKGDGTAIWARDEIRRLQVERDLLAGKLDVAQDALKEIASRCHNRLATIGDIAAPYQHSST